MTADRLVAIPGSHNIRDIGGYPGADSETAWRRFLRADSLHRLDAAGIDRLLALGLATVVDLRRQEELDRAPNPFATASTEVAYRHLPLYDHLDPQDPMFVEAPDPLLALYRMALDERGVAFVRVFRAMAQAAPGAVLFHCSAGKDRTGMIAAFLLRLAGVDDDTIVEDYVLTGRAMPPMIEALRREAAEQGRERVEFAPFMRSDPPTMRGFLRALDDEHGGAEAYLRRHGLPEADIAALRGRLSATPASPETR